MESGEVLENRENEKDYPPRVCDLSKVCDVDHIQRKIKLKSEIVSYPSFEQSINARDMKIERIVDSAPSQRILRENVHQPSSCFA